MRITFMPIFFFIPKLYKAMILWHGKLGVGFKPKNWVELDLKNKKIRVDKKLDCIDQKLDWISLVRFQFQFL